MTYLILRRIEAELLQPVDDFCLDRVIEDRIDEDDAVRRDDGPGAEYSAVPTKYRLSKTLTGSAYHCSRGGVCRGALAAGAARRPRGPGGAVAAGAADRGGGQSGVQESDMILPAAAFAAADAFDGVGASADPSAPLKPNAAARIDADRTGSACRPPGGPKGPHYDLRSASTHLRPEAFSRSSSATPSGRPAKCGAYS